MPNTRVTADTVIHDQSHLEICLNYPVPSHEIGSKKYKTDFYFFVPKAMGVTPYSYPKDRFYSDITNYVRFHTPDVPLEDAKLLNKIAQHIDYLFFEKSPHESTESVIKSVKLFGSMVNKRLSENPSEEVIKQINEYRTSCVDRVSKRTLLVPAELRQVVILVDEYISNRIEVILAENNSEQIKKILDQEFEYRNRQKDLFFIKKSTDSEKEYFFFRQNLLRRQVASPLFLEIKKKRLDDTYRNLVASFGAALAAVWSLFAEHHAYKATQASDFGFQFVVVALFAVVVYVFKDRIKDLSKEYVNEKLKGHIPDMKGILENSGLGISAQTTEYVRYIEEKNVLPEVRFLRRLGGRWDIEAPFPDTVLHYCRSFELKKEISKNSETSLQSIKDILRFNFSFFLKHLDDPIKQSAAYDQEDGPKRVNFPKVYHLNVVVRLEHDQVDFESYRLIFNRTGIIRMEPIFAENQT